MKEYVLESPASIYEVSNLAPTHCRSFMTGEMLNDDELDRLCEAVLSDLSDS